MSERTEAARAVASAVAEASSRIQQWIRRTPLARSAWLSAALGAEVVLKLENFQLFGSFKPRGAANRLLSLSADERAHGVVTASTGNHGAAVAYVARELGVACHVLVPAGTSTAKTRLVERLGATLVVHDGSALDAEFAARSFADRSGMSYVSPYNDSAVIAGQGTVGLEMVEQAEAPLDVVYVSVGGGGLMAGVGSVLRNTWPSVELVGCSPQRSPVMSRSIAAGRMIAVEVEETISDGTAGGVEPATLTFGLCRDLVDRWIELEETSIVAALRDYIVEEGQLIEGSAALPVAAAHQDKGAWKGKRVGLVICGSNISLTDLRRALC